MGKLDKYGNDPDRFFATAEDIKPIGKMRTIDHLTDEERAQNAEHDRIVKEATAGLGDDEDMTEHDPAHNKGSPSF